MKTAIILGASSLLFNCLVTAAPMGKRDVEWVTVTDYTTVTVDMTTTLYVKPTKGPGPGQHYTGQYTGTHIGPHRTSGTSTSTSSTPTPPPQFYVPPPAPTPTPPAEPVATPAAYTPPAPPASPVPAPPPPPAPPAPAPPAPPAPSSPAPSPSGPGSGSSGGECSSGSPCAGDMTFYDAGLGSCGVENDGSTENVVALPHDLMGEQSNGNPYCGKTITIEYKGKKTTAVVKDKCMGCTGKSIDLSRKAFNELADPDAGRVPCNWWFN
ncbi:MAG: hypothetical protein M1813_009444 [Trichoglossum hirsutum]|nr:MAG: hypothetical protein M1813_009444 [Trichoglossum hirsutum]